VPFSYLAAYEVTKKALTPAGSSAGDLNLGARYSNPNLRCNVWLTIRKILKVRGFQVAPAELEGCILDHRDVAYACAVPISDDYSGEVPLAFVVLRAFMWEMTPAKQMK
jgi:acyl-CoA synthetase (AMP-forming)/AMP-acid ligase II